MSVAPNTEYAFYYWLSAWTSTKTMPTQIRCLINGVRTGAAGFTSSAVGEWGVTLIRWNSGTNTQADIRLVDRTGTIAYNDFALDDIGMIPTGGNYVLMTDSTLGGSVDTPGEGAFLYPPGETVILEAKCEPGYEFVGWAGQFSDPSPMVWVDMGTDRVASAVFRKLDYPVTVRASGLAMNEFTLCGDSVDRLSILGGALDSGEPNGLVFGERKSLCGATYRFPIFRPPTGAEGLSKIIVNAYGRTMTSGSTVWIGDTGPYRPATGDVRASFGPSKIAGILEDSQEPVYWLTIRVNAVMGAWDLAAVYVSYDCPGIPKDLLQGFHDCFSVYQSLQFYTRSPGIRDLFALRAYDESVWETVLQTTAFAEDLPDSGGALHKAVHTGIRGFRASLERWRTAVGPGDLAALAACGSEAIGACLDEAVSSGRACIDTYADAIGDGNVSREEALALNQALADWKADLAVLQAAMSRSFEALREVRRNAAKLAGEPPPRWCGDDDAGHGALADRCGGRLGVLDRGESVLPGTGDAKSAGS